MAPTSKLARLVVIQSATMRRDAIAFRPSAREEPRTSPGIAAGMLAQPSEGSCSFRHRAQVRMTVDPPEEGEVFDAAALFRAHAPYVAAFLNRMGVSHEALDDLVQDVFLVAHRRGGFVANGQAKPTTWLAAIAIRVASAHRRSTRRSKEGAASDGSELAAAHHERPDQIAETSESMSRVQQALASLDEKSRGVFVLFELEGASCVDIAASLQIPVGTVYSRLHYARKAFRENYDRLGVATRPRSSSLQTVRVLS
jgi:RNA polymerase sigma-70 factor (ECF subfamily)